MPTRSPSTSGATNTIAGYSDFTDIAGFVSLARVTSLAVSPDGARVVAAVQQPDADSAEYASALWELDPNGTAAPSRLTFSAKGESAPRFAPDGTLLFTSARPDSEKDKSEPSPRSRHLAPPRSR